MKKIRTIEVPPVEEITREVTDYFCDICEKFIDHTLYKKNVCDICKRHCHNNWECGHDHPEDASYDYARTLCRICLDLYNDLMIPLQNKHEASEKSMLKRIKNESTSVTQQKQK